MQNYQATWKTLAAFQCAIKNIAAAYKTFEKNPCGITRKTAQKLQKRILKTFQFELNFDGISRCIGSEYKLHTHCAPLICIQVSSF